MRSLILFILFFLLSVALDAQIRTDPTVRLGLSGIYIRVTDSTRIINLPGASVKLISGRDTANLVTNENGSVSYNKKVKDSIELTVSSLGFNTLSGKIKTAPSIYVALSEKTYGITEVIVKGNMVAVISRGDTTRYNAAAFKTMVGDNMAELFKKFPGMEFNGTNLTFRGTTIERINIDDKRLFNNDVKLALENIRADDVISVDVYKEATDWDKLNNIENGRKQTVANVKTKSKPNRVFNKTIILAGGQEIDKNSEERYEKKYEASGKAVFSQVGKSITANASYKNIVGNSQSKNLDGEFKLQIHKINKLQFLTNNVLTNVKSLTENSSEQIYFPTELYSSRTYNSDEIGHLTKSKFSSKNLFSYTFRTKDIIYFRVNLDYDRTKNDNSNHILATLNGIPTNNLNLNTSNKRRTVGVNGSAGYNKKFGTRDPGVLLSYNASFSISENDNNGWRVDTTTSSTTKIYLTDYTQGWNRSYGTGLELSIPIVKGFSIQVNNIFSYRDSKSERTAIDMLTGLIDTTNTHHYTLNYLKNDLSLYFNHYASKTKSTGYYQTSIKIGWERHEQKRDEFFPTDYSIPRRYDIPTVGLNSMFYIRGQQMVAQVNLKGDPLSIEELRDVIDDRNPTRLSVGNPDLKMPAILDFIIQAPIPIDKKGTMISFLITGKNINNYVTTKTEYFTKETFLPQYNYTVAKGATLTTKENVSESWSFNSSAGLYMRLLGSNVGLSLGYAYEKTPSYIEAELHTLTIKKYSCNFSVNTSFSSVFDVKLNSSSILIKSFNGIRNNDSFIENLTIEPRFQLGSKSKLLLRGNYYHYENRQMPNTRRNDFILNSSIYRRLDKKGNFTLGIQVNDILNQQSSIAINLGEDYTSTVRTLIPGRYWLVKAELKF
ncbi:MAG: hypothetical protein A2X18_10975 [Bacteroidetes bacterium GWF2_40_14]|nr:MAG: hypothetical protein A2X18_10975 [Bacteroidetes bacterium GWF2_40_14]